MLDLIESHRTEVEDLCRKHRVAKLEVFGSAVMGYGDLFVAGVLGGLLAAHVAQVHRILRGIVQQRARIHTNWRKRFGRIDQSGNQPGRGRGPAIAAWSWRYPPNQNSERTTGTEPSLQVRADRKPVWLRAFGKFYPEWAAAT